MDNTQLARQDVEARLAEERRLRGVAMRNGNKPKNVSTIVALELELDALEDAESAIAQRDREQQAAEQVKCVKKRKDNLRACGVRYIEKYRQFEIALRHLAATADALLEEPTHICPTAHALTGKAAPTSFGIKEVEQRMSADISAAMASIPGHCFQLGSLQWQPRWHKPEDDFCGREAALVERHLGPITE